MAGIILPLGSKLLVDENGAVLYEYPECFWRACIVKGRITIVRSHSISDISNMVNIEILNLLKYDFDFEDYPVMDIAIPIPMSVRSYTYRGPDTLIVNYRIIGKTEKNG